MYGSYSGSLCLYIYLQQANKSRHPDHFFDRREVELIEPSSWIILPPWLLPPSLDTDSANLASDLVEWGWFPLLLALWVDAPDCCRGGCFVDPALPPPAVRWW
mmetsp:Transcript_20688/g.58934  ORF Transcript_20688/g.58934 Transcript_20688/m.58934 type:complete len:103 (+) Transcript_20688:25-333(+)